MFGPLLFLFLGLVLVVVAIVIVSTWKVYTKAGKPGWTSIIPIYNFVVLLEIVGKPIWWVVFMFIPVANVIISIIIYYELSKAFGKGIGYTAGLIVLPFIFFPMLAFGDAVYSRSSVASPPISPPNNPPPPTSTTA